MFLEAVQLVLRCWSWKKVISAITKHMPGVIKSSQIPINLSEEVRGRIRFQDIGATAAPMTTNCHRSITRSQLFSRLLIHTVDFLAGALIARCSEVASDLGLVASPAGPRSSPWPAVIFATVRFVSPMLSLCRN